MTDPNARPAFLRRITIQDSMPDDGDQMPVHVGNRVLFDGVECPPSLIDLRDGWDATGSLTEGSVVSFTVDAARVKFGAMIKTESGEPTGKYENFEINGIPVLVPQGVEWESEDEDPPPGVPAKVRVHIFVREFEFLAAPAAKAGDRVEDGGIVGTLVRCEKCSGDGLLHKPDELPASQEPN